MSIQRSRVSIGWIMPLYWQNLSTLHKMYGHDTFRNPCMTSCPICYCMVEEKFMSMHVLWHEEPDEEESPAQYVPISQSKYDL